MKTPSRTIPFVQIVLLFAALLALIRPASAQNAGISFDFNTPDQYRNTPYNILSNNFLNNQLPSIPFEVVNGGVGPAPGSGALDLRSGGTEQTSILTAYPIDFSAAGTTLTASVMIKIKAPTANQRMTQIGFVTAT